MILHHLQSLDLFNDMVHVYIPCWCITDAGNEGLFCNAALVLNKSLLCLGIYTEYSRMAINKALTSDKTQEFLLLASN